jgi:hypothetical protein
MRARGTGALARVLSISFMTALLQALPVVGLRPRREPRGDTEK